MAPTGNNTEARIWNHLKGWILNDYGVAALMGNLYAESGLNPRNLQNSCEKRLGYTDDTYTAAVDSGAYSGFVRDAAGYGLAQWTYWSRKEALLAYVKAAGASVGDLEAQLGFLRKELAESYPSILAALKSAKSVREASDVILTKYERPADQSENVKIKRAGYGQTYLNKYAGGSSAGKEGNTMSNSSLVNCTVYSPNHSGKRTHSIDTLTPHCVVGQLTAEAIGGCFPKGREASCNYGIGKDGRVCLIVDECNRSWCSSSNSNDQRAITIECASDKSHPYAMNSAVYEKLIQLCADICKRYGKTKVLWLGSKEKTLAYTPKSNEIVLTAHRWFANKSCPGDWLYSRYGELAERINALLGSGASTGSSNSGSSGSGSTSPLWLRSVLRPDWCIFQEGKCRRAGGQNEGERLRGARQECGWHVQSADRRIFQEGKRRGPTGKGKGRRLRRLHNHEQRQRCRILKNRRGEHGTVRRRPTL